MAKPANFYRQARLRCGTVEQTRWIPEHLAGQRLIEHAESGETWEVLEVYPTRVSGEYLAEYERDYRRQREASDI